MKIPSQDDWAGYEDDLDARYAYRNFFGRTIDEAVPLFHENPIERCDELRFMPPVTESVQAVAEARAFYDADPHIYGNFKDIAARIRAACG